MSWRRFSCQEMLTIGEWHLRYSVGAGCVREEVTMSDNFDAYYDWLGIAPKDQPPNHYRLLGVDLFEPKADVIANAADQRMAHVRSFQSGKHSQLSQKLLNEIAAARVCLLNPQKRLAYDARLRESIAPPSVPSTVAPPVASESAAPPPVVDLLDFAPSYTANKRRGKGRRSKSSAGGWIVFLVAMLVMAGIAAATWDQWNAFLPPLLQTASQPSGGTAEKHSGHVTETPPESKASPESQTPSEEKRGKTPERHEPRPKTEVRLKPQPFETLEKEGEAVEDLAAMGGGADAQAEAQIKPKPKPRSEDEPSEERLPVPDAAAQRSALLAARETYREDYKDKLNLPILFLQKAEETRDPAGRFVLLQEAKNAAAEAIVGDLAFEAIEAMADAYDVSGLALKAELVEKWFKRTRLTPEQKAAIVQSAMQVLDEAVNDEEFDFARLLGKRLTQFAGLSKNRELVLEVAAKNKAVLAAGRGFTEIQEKQEALNDKPDDPDLNLTVGKYLCFQKGDWEKGLPLLALGSDETLKSLAERDGQGPVSVGEQVALADAWWDAGGVKRAGYWYQKALPGLSGLQKDKAQKRLAGLKLSRSSMRGPVTLKQALEAVELISVAYQSKTPFEIAVHRQVICQGTAAEDRGLHVVAFHQGKVVVNRCFDFNGKGDTASKDFVKTIGDLPNGAIVILSVVDDATSNFDAKAQAAIHSIGAGIGLLKQPPRSTYYCIGQKGLKQGMACERIGTKDLRYPPGQ